jgi:hypothetical protein
MKKINGSNLTQILNKIRRMKMNLREAYKQVIIHLLELAEERGEESLSEMSSDAKALLAMDMLNDDNCTDKLVEAIEDYIEDYGGDIGLW